MSIKHSHQGRFKVGIDLFGIGVGCRGTVLALPGLRNTRHREHRLDVITFQKPHRRTNFLVRHVNAGTAAIVLMTVPFWVAFWQAIAQKRVPRKAEIFCFVLAMSGVVLIVTHGDFSSLNFDARGVAWGLGSAFATTGYTIQPRALLMRAPAVAVMGWAMFFGGVIASLFSPPWAISYDWSMKTTLLVLFVVSVGTVVAFWCYLLAVRLISPVIVGLLICSEPLSAYILSVAFLQMRISEAEIFGAGFVLAAVIIVTTAGKLSGKKSSRAGS